MSIPKVDVVLLIVLLFLSSYLAELDDEGTIPPDDDPPQEMGDHSIEVTEDMRDKAQEERQQGSMAMAEGETFVYILYCTAASFVGELSVLF